METVTSHHHAAALAGAAGDSERPCTGASSVTVTARTVVAADGVVDHTIAHMRAVVETLRTRGNIHIVPERT